MRRKYISSNEDQVRCNKFVIIFIISFGTITNNYRRQSRDKSEEKFLLSFPFSMSNSRERERERAMGGTSERSTGVYRLSDDGKISICSSLLFFSSSSNTSIFLSFSSRVFVHQHHHRELFLVLFGSFFLFPVLIYMTVTSIKTDITQVSHTSQKRQKMKGKENE